MTTNERPADVASIDGADSMDGQAIIEKDNTAAHDLLALAEHLSMEFPLDVQGAADLFCAKHGHADGLDSVRPYPSFAFDRKGDTWRQWQSGKGWIPRGSILEEMMDCVSVLCEVEALRKNDFGAAPTR